MIGEAITVGRNHGKIVFFIFYQFKADAPDAVTVGRDHRVDTRLEVREFKPTATIGHAIPNSFVVLEQENCSTWGCIESFGIIQSIENFTVVRSCINVADNATTRASHPKHLVPANMRDNRFHMRLVDMQLIDVVVRGDVASNRGDKGFDRNRSTCDLDSIRVVPLLIGCQNVHGIASTDVFSLHRHRVDIWSNSWNHHESLAIGAGVMQDTVAASKRHDRITDRTRLACLFGYKNTRAEFTGNRWPYPLRNGQAVDLLISFLTSYVSIQAEHDRREQRGGRQ